MTALLCCCAGVRADDDADVHSVIGDVANALSAGDPADAMSGFSKKCPNYQRLSEDFEALTDAYFVSNRVQFSDEEVSATEATVALHWDLAVTTKQTDFTKNRSADLTLKLVREGKHWRIIEFGPIEIFDPQGLGN